MTVLRRLASVTIALAVLVSAGPAIASPPPPDRSWAHYFAVKTVMQRLFDADAETRPLHLRRPAVENRYDLVNCNRGSEFTGAGTAHNVTADFADIALDVVIWRDAFRRFGFPAELWQPMLVEYEQHAVDRAIAAPGSENPEDQTFEHTLAGRLNPYSAAHRGVPAIVVNGGCGAGEGTVIIATAPVGAQVLFIPTFFYELCKVQKQNADDPNSCPRWREAIEGKLQSVAGDYLYHVRWPDGTTRRGTLRFDLGDDGKTITLRKP